jgi:hypothetical protein
VRKLRKPAQQKTFVSMESSNDCFSEFATEPMEKAFKKGSIQ